MIFFNSEYLPDPKVEYILWCDVMGQGRQMIRSMHMATNHLFRLHTAFGSYAGQTNVRTYPVMDGVYVTCNTYECIVDIIRFAFGLLAREFIAAHGARRKFMIRAGLAFGPTLHGRDVPDEAFYDEQNGEREYSRDSYERSEMPAIKNQIFLSPAMAWAFEVERQAPPFGIFVHESAQAMPQAVNPRDRGFSASFFRWWAADEDGRRLAQLTAHQVEYYLAKARMESLSLGYSLDRIDCHRAMAVEYFASFWPEAQSRDKEDGGEVMTEREHR